MARKIFSMKRYTIQKQPGILQLKKEIAMKIKRHKDYLVIEENQPYKICGLLKIIPFEIGLVWKNFIKLKSTNYICIWDYKTGKHLTKKQLHKLQDLLK